MINLGRELLRISPKDPKKLEFSTNHGRTWNTRYCGSSSVGEFIDMTEDGDELLANTSRGLFYSRNEGRVWNRRSR